MPAVATYPDFYAQVSPLVLHDPLAALLAAAPAGRIEYHYVDAVKLAGHSCPTVAGAWLLARVGLAALYGEELPERGGIRVELRAPQAEGTAGVVAAVLGLLTGAAGEGGFAGLAGRFGRRGLLVHGVAMTAQVRLTRLRDGKTVELDYRPEAIPADPALPPLMARLGEATEEERQAFGRLWQERVRRILLEGGDALVQVS